jgi:cephalosporin hydroxylase
MKYTNSKEYFNTEHAAILQKVLKNCEAYKDLTNPAWPAFHGIYTHNPFLNVLFHYVDTGKINKPEEINLFIETGTWWGATTAHFASIFDTVHTSERYDFDFMPENHFRNLKTNYPNITFWKGNSPDCLANILQQESEKRAVFLLDAHRGNVEVPLIEEIEKIKTLSKTNKHFIMIDDCIDCGVENFPTEQVLRSKLLELNPEFTIEQTGYGRGILVAY